MKISIVITLALIVSSLCVAAQDDYKEHETIGFGCFYEGRKTEPVVKFAKLIKRENYKAISDSLTSKNTAYRYLAAITLQRLSATGKYTASTTEQKLIKDIKQSSDPIMFCSGCFTNKALIKDLFEPQMLTMAEHWLDRTVGTVDK